jgi:hypothetical protein
MKRKLIIITLLLIILIVSCLTGCSVPNKNYLDYKPEYGPQFICVEKYKDPYLGYTYILVDKNTRIMYMFIDDSDAQNRGLSVLYDSEGNVRRYNGAIIE